MFKLGRIMLWILPFTWPIAIWRSVKHGRDERQRELVEIINRGQAAQHAFATGEPYVPPTPQARPRRHWLPLVVATAVLVAGISAGGAGVTIGIIGGLVILAVANLIARRRAAR